MKTMKFYKELEGGKVAVLAVTVNQNIGWRGHNESKGCPPIFAETIARREGFLKKKEFGEARLRRALAERRLLEPDRVTPK